MNYGSLFSGIGGIDLGLDRAGLTCAWQVEKDPACRNVLEHHWPGVPRYDDITTVHGTGSGGSRARGRGSDRDATRHRLQLAASEQRGQQSAVTHSNGNAVGCDRCLPTVDLICGGFPCTDVSVAGRRAGLDGAASGLWHQQLRIIAGVLPRWVLVENVPGLLSADDGVAFGRVLQGLVNLGYGVAWRVLDAQYFGVPQRRRRVFLVGHLGEPWSAPGQVLFEPEDGDGDTAPGREAGQDLAGTLGGGTGGRGWAPDTDRMTFVPTTAWALQARDGKGPDSDTKPGHLIPTTNAGGLGVSMAVRRLTPRLCECERLQGFPDGWSFGSDSVRYRMLGNAVAVPVAEWIGRRLMHHSGAAGRTAIGGLLATPLSDRTRRTP